MNRSACQPPDRQRSAIREAPLHASTSNSRTNSVSSTIRYPLAVLAILATFVSSGIAQRQHQPPIRAQQLVDETVRRHPRLRAMEIALLSDSGCATIAATAPEDIGEQCNADENGPIKTGQPDVEAPTRDDPVYDITQALHDTAGAVIGAVGMDLAPQEGETQAAMLQLAHTILLELEASIPTKGALLKPVVQPDGGARHD